LLLELALIVERQKDIFVYYHGKVVGDYRADLIVNGLVLLEIKSVERLIDAHDAQLLNYLKATEIEVGLLLNFGREAEFHRKIFDNSRKGSLHWTKNP
jgi:GxxExxY protein